MHNYLFNAVIISDTIYYQVQSIEYHQYEMKFNGDKNF